MSTFSPSSPDDAPAKAAGVQRKPVAPTVQAVTHLCPQCGTGVETLPISSSNSPTFATPASASEQSASTEEDSAQKQRRIEALQLEVDRLADKASAATDKLADYEDEIRALRAQTHQRAPSLLSPGDTPPRPHTADEAHQTPSGLPPLPETAPFTSSPVTTSPQQIPQSALRRAASMRLSYFLTRKSSSQSEPSASDSVPLDPQAALHSERTQRIAAESKLTQVNTEIEELSATLFQQANEMVATERRERAEAEERAEKRSAQQSKQLKEQGAQIRKLQERIQILEERDKERAKRLEKLEKGMQRVGRVRGLLNNAQEQRRVG